MDNSNSNYIDLWHIKVGYGKAPKHKQEWKDAMRKIRMTHICIRCRKYPGDTEYRFGKREPSGAYICYDCL